MKCPECMTTQEMEINREWSSTTDEMVEVNCPECGAILARQELDV